MNIFDKLNAESISALKEHNTVKRETYTSVIAAIKKAMIDEKVKELTDDFVIKVLTKERKILAEQVDTCPESRQDLLVGYKTKLAYIDTYMPKLMSKAEVTEFVKSNVPNDVLVSKNVGAIMKTVMPLLKGKADGKVINEVVKEVANG